MPELFYIFHSFTNWFTNVFLILMFVDCFFLNRSQRGSKWWWFFVLMWGNWIGALIYCLVGPSFLLQKALPHIRKALSSAENWYRERHRQATPMPAPYEPPYTAYQQGHQSQQPESPPQAELFVAEDQYEQPQATYPDLPAQQQQQRHP
jgi:hypothetical protein